MSHGRSSRSSSAARGSRTPTAVSVIKEPPPTPSGWALLWQRCTASCSCARVCEGFKQLVPAAEWVPRYRWRQQLAGDVSAGLVVAVMHVPQGLGYAMLAGAAPVAGLYVALLPVCVYALFGTSRHISVGTFAVSCLMTGHVVSEQTQRGASAEGAVSAVSLCCGALLLALWALRLGALCRVLSETLVSAVTTGAAAHVLTSQLLVALGVAHAAPRRHGPLRLVYTFADLCSGGLPPRLPAVITTLACIAALALYQVSMPTSVSRWLSAELVVLAAATATASQVDFAARWNMSVVGDVPVGLPTLRNPASDWRLLAAVAAGACGVAAVGLAVSTSMALLLARGQYHVRLNQELLAHGLAAVAAAVSGGVPPAASLSRSLLQRSAGGSTQLASLVSCLVLLGVIMGASPLFEPLPRAVLAGVIIMALRGILMAAWRDVPRMFRLSALDGGVWVATFLGVALLDTALGLVVGALLSLLFLVARGAKPRAQLLGVVVPPEGPTAYVELEENANAVEVPGVRIVRLLTGAALAFPSREELREQVVCAVGVDPARVLDLQRAAAAARPDSAEQRLLLARAEELATPAWRLRPGRPPEPRRLAHVVLDIAKVTSCDFSSARGLQLLAEAFASIDVSLTLVLEKPLYSLDSVLSVDAAVRLVAESSDSED